MTIKLVIFDCDGVLVDTEPLTDQVMSDDLSARGYPVAPHDVHRLFAGGTMQGVADTARAGGANLPPNWIDQIYAKVFAALRQGVPVVPGVIDLLDRLDAAGIEFVVASNGPLPKMEISLGPSGLYDRLAGRLMSGHDFEPKPSPAMLLAAMHRFGVTPDETAMIDDMPAGWVAAKAAGAQALAYVADGGIARATGDVTPFTDMADVPGLIGLSPAS